MASDEKICREVAVGLATKVFPYLGLPKIKDCEMLAEQETLMEYELEIENETLTKEYDCLK